MEMDMKVEGIGNAVSHAAAAAKLADKMGSPKAAGDESTEETPSVPEPAGTRAKGVLRLLQEGHFKGVADVRLRINFHAELTAIAHENLVPVVEDKVAGIISAVSIQVDILVTSGELTDEQTGTATDALEAFREALEQLVEEFIADGGADTSSLLGEVETAFEVLVEALSPLLTYLAPQETGEGTDVSTELDEEGALLSSTVSTVEVEDTATSPEPDPEVSPLTDFLEQLEAVFAEALGQLRSAIEGAAILPPLSEPSGNGGAYAKFLAIYNELYGITDGGDAGSEPVEEVDAIV
jgi:hypothetical protein